MLSGFWFVVQVQRFTVSSFLGASTIMGDLGIAAGAAGLLSAAYFPGYGLMQVVSGTIADRGRPRLLLLMSGPAIVVACGLLALAPGFGMALFARFVTGLASGAVMLPSLRLGAARLPSVGFGGLAGPLIGVGLGAGLTTVLAMPLLLDVLDWRPATMLVTLPLLPLSVLLLSLPEAARPGPAQQRSSPTGASAGQAARTILGNAQFRAVLLIFVAWTGLQFGLLSWLPRYSSEVLDLPREQTGLLSGLVLVGAMLGSNLAALATRRSPRARRRWLLGAGLLLAALTGGMTLAGPWLLSAGPLGLALVVGLGVTLGQFPIVYVLIEEIMPRELLGTATGVLNAAPFLIGAFVFPWLIGAIMDLIDRPATTNWTYSQAAYTGGFLTAAGLLAVCAVVAGSLLLWPRPSAHGAPDSERDSERV